jgi:hypothetical protein
VELRSPSASFLGGDPWLASPALQIARSLAGCSSKHSLGFMRRQPARAKLSPSFSMCSLLTARHAVVHLTSCSEASSEANHCEVNVIIGQHCDPLNLPKSPWLLIVSNGFFRGFLFRTSHFSITQTPSRSQVLNCPRDRCASSTPCFNKRASNNTVLYISKGVVPFQFA